MLKLSIFICFILYDIILNLLFFLFFPLAIFLPKFRRYLYYSILDFFRLMTRNAKYDIWFHASSAGEVDQLIPIIDSITNKRILVSYFSMSARYYQNIFRNRGVDFYILPFDIFPFNIMFLLKIGAKKIVFSRYDIWAGYIMLAKLLSKPLYAINVTIERSSGRLKLPFRYFYRFIYGLFDHIIFVSKADRNCFKTYYNLDGEVVGDTRIARVLSRARKTKKPLVGDNKNILVLGSVWREDIEVLKLGLKTFLEEKNTRLIIVPHELAPTFIDYLMNEFKDFKPKKYTSYRILPKDFKVLIIDKIGVLFDFYSIANLVYVGGGFGASVHSVLEPAVFGIPVAFGPRIENSRDIPYLRDKAMLFDISSSEDFLKFLQEAYKLKKLNKNTIEMDLEPIIKLLL